MTKPKAKKSKRQRGPRTAADEAPLTTEQIIEAGVRLTAARGLAGWSTRDLAKEVGCWPTAIVHRVGPRHEVDRVIVDAVMRSVDLPSPELSWRPWISSSSPRCTTHCPHTPASPAGSAWPPRPSLRRY